MSIPDNPFGAHTNPNANASPTSPTFSPGHTGSTSPSASASASAPAGPARTISPPILNIDTRAMDSPLPLTPRHEAGTVGTGGTGGSSPNGTQSPTGVSRPASSHQTPGGTLLVPGQQPGTKTPRRVQWTSDSHIVSINTIEPYPSSPTHTVDENNISAVHAALERHQSQQIPHGSVRRRPPSMLSQGSSAGDEVITDGEDYDYRLDIDPPQTHLHPITSAGSATANNEQDSLQQLLGNDINDHVTSFIPLGETDGLPNIPTADPDKQDDHDEAKNLVRAHTGKWGVLRRRVKGAGAVHRAFNGATTPGGSRPLDDAEKAAEEQNAFAARYPDPQGGDGLEQSRSPRGHAHGESQFGASGMHHLPNMPGGASVLSSLLALYGQQNIPGSGTTSAASSRPNSDDEDSSEDERRRKAAVSAATRKQSVFSRKSLSRESHESSSPSQGDVTPDIRQPIETKPASQFGGIGTHHRSKSTSSLVERMDQRESSGFIGTLKRYKNQIEEADRPKAARSGAGVFGALMQNTANLSGVATPAASSLTPAARRPGYQLDRYSMPEPNAPDINVPWRPSSRPSSRAGSRPGSVHSSTAVSGNGDSPKDDFRAQKPFSSDDMLNMKGEKHKKAKNLTLDSLGNLGKLPGAALKTGGHALKNTEKWIMSGGKTPLITPPEKGMGDYFSRPLTEDERRRKEWEQEKKRRKKAKEARKKQEIFIIQHVAAILSRQQFLMKLARALMMFGSPSHRLETQIQATARVLEINAQVVYLPGTMLIAFGDDATHTSETKFLKQATGLDLGKLLATHNIYWNVIHDKMSVEQASKDLDVLMTSPVYYNVWQTLIIGALCSAFITVIGFNGSFIDALMTMPLGMLLVAIQMLAARNDMFSNVFEIAIATLISFISAGLASTEKFCYTALVSGGVVLILPGYIVLTGALELASRNITAGSVRIGYSVIYSLFLGFGISIGAEFYRKITGLEVVGANNNFTCQATHSNVPWYQSTPSGLWWILCAPGFAMSISMRNQQPLFAKELPVMVIIACAGWASNHFSGLAFKNRSDMTSAIGSFVVGTLGNIYGRFSNGSSFPVTVAGILFQLPSGLSNGGIFNFAEATSNGESDAYSSGFKVAQQLVAVAIGLTVGLFVSAVVTHPFGGGRKRGSGIFSF